MAVLMVPSKNVKVYIMYFAKILNKKLSFSLDKRRQDKSLALQDVVSVFIFCVARTSI